MVIEIAQRQCNCNLIVIVIELTEIDPCMTEKLDFCRLSVPLFLFASYTQVPN